MAEYSKEPLKKQISNFVVEKHWDTLSVGRVDRQKDEFYYSFMPEQENNLSQGSSDVIKRKVSNGATLYESIVSGDPTSVETPSLEKLLQEIRDIRETGTSGKRKGSRRR